MADEIGWGTAPEVLGEGVDAPVDWAPKLNV